MKSILHALSATFAAVLLPCVHASGICPPDDELAQTLPAQINAIRAHARICGSKSFRAAPPLVWNRQLEEAARNHAEDMLERGYFSHSTPEGLSPGQRIETAGYDWQSIGENIAKGQHDLNQTLRDWLASPEHCLAMMQDRFTEVGLACADDDDTSYWVLELGKPR